MWERWISEIVADLWAIGRIGISSTQGLISVVSLPSYFVFRIDAADPHPPPWIRVKLSALLGEMLYPDPQWRRLRTVWRAYYPTRRQSLTRRRELRHLEASMPAFAQLLLSHQPASLHGHSLAEVVVRRDRTPAALRSAWRSWQDDRRRAFDTAPSRALAVIGQARADGRITAAREARLVGRLLTHWALRSTLDIADICAVTTGTPATDRRRQILEAPRAVAA